jgi:nucleotide-binding universal stress UspA family protein
VADNVHTYSHEDDMTYRSIFVHADDTEPCARRMDYAARLAQRYPAELHGSYLPSPNELTAYAKAVMSQGEIDKYAQMRVEQRNAAETAFRNAAQRAGVASVEWDVPARRPIGAAVLRARHSDLAILGQPPRDDSREDFANELANAVVMRSGRPVLFFPSVGDFSTIGERVLIAWKDSRESARAIADALPILKDAKKVIAVAVTREADESANERFTDAQLKVFLARHDVAATVRRIAAADIDAGELLLSQAADLGADLIVMGAYSRPRLTELVWGGVTSVMLSSMTAPVLMSH